MFVVYILQKTNICYIAKSLKTLLCAGRSSCWTLGTSRQILMTLIKPLPLPLRVEIVSVVIVDVIIIIIVIMIAIVIIIPINAVVVIIGIVIFGIFVVVVFGILFVNVIVFASSLLQSSSSSSKEKERAPLPPLGTGSCQDTARRLATVSLRLLLFYCFTELAAVSLFC